jgi:hypothetical protein
MTMHENRSWGPTAGAALLLVLGTACADVASPGGAAEGGPVAAGAAATGVYAGTYEVPVSADLAGAATFAVPEIEWTLAAGTATLRYALPRGLVGKTLRVDFSGAVDTAAGTATLSGPAGTAACELRTGAVVCNEVMSGLLPLAPDYAVVEQIAQTDLAGLSAQRLEVAKQFAIDPIGIVHVDLGSAASATPEPEDPAGG